MKIKAQPQPLAIVTSYTPLVTRFGIVATGGSRTQFYYTNEGQFIPSRAVTPLLLKAHLNVVDPDGIIPTGDKTSNLAVQWYENSYEYQITADTAGYIINPDNSITVTKDVMPESPVQILARATYNDPRNGNALIYEDRMTLSSIRKADNVLTIYVDKPSKIRFNPIDDPEIIDITATLKLGVNVVDEGAKFFWYTVNNGAETLIDESDTAIEYVSGQGTATLRINASYTNFSILRVKATTGEIDEKTPYADIAVVYSLPEVKAQVYSPNGCILRGKEVSKMFKCVLNTSKRILSDAEIAEHFLIKWYQKPIVAGGTASHIGDGATISIPTDKLRLQGRQAMNVFPTVYSRGAYGYVVNGNGKAVITTDNKLIITRT